MSDSFKRFVLDQLGQVAQRITSRSMFGGTGIYSAGRFFALIAGDTLYLKVDDRNRQSFEAIGSTPFQPFPDKPMTMSYYDVPLEVLEYVPRLRPLVDSAIAAAENSKKKKKAVSSKKPRGK